MNKLVNVLLLGCGEVGTALKRIEEEANNSVFVIELNKELPQKLDYACMHVCIPCKNIRFFNAVIKKYIKLYSPKLVIVHSTTKYGTIDKLKSKIKVPVVHSYVRGVHPNLYEGIKTFVKYVGGTPEDCQLACDYLKSIGLKSEVIGNALTSEFAKLWDTTQYGTSILQAKRIKLSCDKFGLNFDDVYTRPNKTYNEGYAALGMSNVIRPILYAPKGKIGGHCVTENWELLPDKKFAKICKKLNELDSL